MGNAHSSSFVSAHSPEVKVTKRSLDCDISAQPCPWPTNGLGISSLHIPCRPTTAHAGISLCERRYPQSCFSTGALPCPSWQETDIFLVVTSTSELSVSFCLFFFFFFVCVPWHLAWCLAWPSLSPIFGLVVRMFEPDGRILSGTHFEILPTTLRFAILFQRFVSRPRPVVLCGVHLMPRPFSVVWLPTSFIPILNFPIPQIRYNPTLQSLVESSLFQALNRAAYASASYTCGYFLCYFRLSDEQCATTTNMLNSINPLRFSMLSVFFSLTPKRERGGSVS